MQSSRIIRELSINKTPALCTGPGEMRAGDILIFNNSPRNHGPGAKLSTGMQGMLNESGGHKEAGHAGFLVDIGGTLHLAHLMGDGFNLESFDDVDNPDPEVAKYLKKYLKRTVNIYRPREKYSKELNRHLTDIVIGRRDHENDVKRTRAQVVASVNDKGKEEEQPDSQNESRGWLNMGLDDEPDFTRNLFNVEERQSEIKLHAENQRLRKLREGLKKLRWSIPQAIRSFVHRLVGSLRIVNRDPNNKANENYDELPDRVVASDSICSKYVADTYISACNRMTKECRGVNDLRRSLMNVSSYTTPKTLQAYLYRCTNYDYLVMPHVRKTLLSKIIDKVNVEINRLLGSRSSAAKRKGEDLSDALNSFLAKIGDDANINNASVAQSVLLLQELSPILRRNTGNTNKLPKSYRRVMSYAKLQGIYPEYIAKTLVQPRGEETKVSKQAMDCYGYDEKTARLYSRYRRLGYSDKEARFECEPEFGDWYKLGLARNIALTCTVVGFFAWVLPRGLSRVKQAHDQEMPAPREPVGYQVG